MAEWNEIVPVYEIAKFAREAFNKARKKTNELKELYFTKGENLASVREGLSTIEPDIVFDERRAKELADAAHQSEWGGVPITREEVRLEPKDETQI